MRPRDYRDWGVRCMLMASEATDPGQKAALLDMAQRWNELADQVEKAQVTPRPANDD
jgi:hypothetical protein